MPETKGKRSVGRSPGRTPPPAPEREVGPPTALVNLLYQLLETELGGAQVYRTALRAAVRPDLQEEWTHYLRETLSHVETARTLLADHGLDPEADVAARLPVRLVGTALVSSIEAGIASGDPEAAQLAAADAVVLAETKDHQNWSLLSDLAQKGKGDGMRALRAAAAEVEEQEDHHVYHNQGWARELWKKALGLKATLPPPEEEEDVDSMAEAATARKRQSR
jgi:hypothetical protein